MDRIPALSHCGPTGTESSGSRLTSLLAARMARFLALDWIALYAESRAAAPPSFDHADDSVDQANQRRYDTARKDALESNPDRAARTLLGAPLLNPFDSDIEPQMRAQFTPKVAPVPFDDSIEPLVFSDPSYKWEVLDIDISAGDGESASVASLAFVLDHLPRRKAPDAFGGRFDHWGLLPCDAINDAVLDFNNCRVLSLRGLWRTYSGARGFIVENGERGGRKARVVRSVHCLRKISLRTAVMQQFVSLCRLFESFGQGGTEAACDACNH